MAVASTRLPKKALIDFHHEDDSTGTISAGVRIMPSASSWARREIQTRSGGVISEGNFFAASTGW